MKEITIEDLQSLTDPLIVDVRSPSEYSEDHLPGAINLPVLSDDERDRIGTIYHQDSQFKARREGAKTICRNVPEIIDFVDGRTDTERPLLIYCWRGGQRSQSLSIILDRIGYNVHRLKGGYKAYRRQVHDYLREGYWPKPVMTIYGLTGAGKTRLLEVLSDRGHPTADLEGAANHRGSAFGGIGRGPQPSQKKFENNLYQQLTGTEGPVYTEGESRKIGQRIIPDPFFEDLVSPPRVWLDTDLERRVEIIEEDYPWPESRGALLEGLEKLTERLGNDTVDTLQNKLRTNQLKPVIRSLLTNYYDPAYRQSCPDLESFDLILDGNEPDAAIDTLLEFSHRSSPSSN